MKTNTDKSAASDAHERHRELACTPLAAWLLAKKEGRSALRPPPKCPWWPYVFSQRSTVLVQPDGRVPAGSARLRVRAAPGSRLVHCLHPNGDIPDEPPRSSRTLLVSISHPDSSMPLAA